jgi:carbon catabolite-derepressing protein kinase
MESGKQTPEQQAVTARRLKPHSRGSQINLDKSATKPEKMTPLPAKKLRNTKWQFGIRSRNSPAEAMFALYKALEALGADWEAPKIRNPRANRRHSRSASSRSSSGSVGRNRDRYDSDSDGGVQHWSDEEGDVDKNHRQQAIHHSLGSRNGSQPTSTNSLDRGRARDRQPKYGPHNDWGYQVPVDPWVINARFNKSGLYPPGVMAGSSAHSSRVDLTDVEEELARRKASTKDTEISAADTASYDGPPSARELPDEGRDKVPDENLYVYITIQLYTIEKEFYLVDFKCAGYERLHRKLVREVKMHLSNGEVEWRRLGDTEKIDNINIREREELVGMGRTNVEKHATSPFPFLDFASKLVVELAEGSQG